MLIEQMNNAMKTTTSVTPLFCRNLVCVVCHIAKKLEMGERGLILDALKGGEKRKSKLWVVPAKL